MTRSAGRCRRLLVAAALLVALATVIAAVTSATAAPGAAPSAAGPVGTAPAVRPGVSDLPRSAGCGRPPSPGPRATATPTGDLVQLLRVGSLTRSYRLAVPTGYRPSVPTPLILLFHGSGSDALQTSIYTQLPRRASRAGFLVATPDAVDGTWTLSAPGARTDDLALVKALITSLSSRYCVDPDRVFAAGISLGSEFAAISACTSSLRIAAVGLVAAEFLLRPCPGPLPVIAFHGTADPIVAYRSGATGAAVPGVPVIGVEENMAHWARLDRCNPHPRTRRLHSMVVRRTWSGCAGSSSVVLYTVLGGGHTWPGSPIALSPGTFGPTTEQIDATGLMLAFFHRHPLER
jgi:polyhydroxybutyrate depolymerase